MKNKIQVITNTVAFRDFATPPYVHGQVKIGMKIPAENPPSPLRFIPDQMVK
jgi:hypothetical protein